MPPKKRKLGVRGPRGRKSKRSTSTTPDKEECKDKLKLPENGEVSEFSEQETKPVVKDLEKEVADKAAEEEVKPELVPNEEQQKENATVNVNDLDPATSISSNSPPIVVVQQQEGGGHADCMDVNLPSSTAPLPLVPALVTARKPGRKPKLGPGRGQGQRRKVKDKETGKKVVPDGSREVTTEKKAIDLSEHDVKPEIKTGERNETEKPSESVSNTVIPPKTTEEMAPKTKNLAAPLPSTSSATATTVPGVPRKPGFFRGRRSKALSSRSGRKELVHQAEEIDPEELRGYEHFERYVTPADVKLPKFWDSEDEFSDEDNSDNFRRIMCGFGTNCRIHEVIRPASEIVRRLKELQNTFGASRTLPLFARQNGGENVGDASGSSESATTTCYATEIDNDNFPPITWHNDPSFFEFANNFPKDAV